MVKNNKINKKKSIDELTVIDLVESVQKQSKINAGKQQRVNALLKGLQNDVALKVYTTIINLMRQKGVESFPSTYKQLFNVLEQDNHLNIKIFTDNGIPEEAVARFLLNLMIGPVQKMKDDIDGAGEKIDTAVIAIYGATVTPMKKRVAALDAVSKKVELNNGIIISGGRSWTSIVPKKYREDIMREYNSKQEAGGEEHASYMKIELDREVIFRMKKALECFIKELNPDYKSEENGLIVDAFLGEDGAEWLRAVVLEKSKLIGGLSKITSIRELISIFNEDDKKRIESILLKRVIDDKVKNEINKDIKGAKKGIVHGRAMAIMRNIGGKDDVKTYVHGKHEQIWMELLSDEIEKAEQEISKGKNGVYKEEKLEKLQTKLNELKRTQKDGYAGMYNKYIQSKYYEIINSEELRAKYESIFAKEEQNENSFDIWLKEYIENEYIKNAIIHELTEVEAMQLEWNQYKSKNYSTKSNVVEDRQSANTNENAVHTIEEFIKLRKNHPEIKDLIVISDWQYLMRQLLTTKKAAHEMGMNDINIIGYPASAIKKYEGRGVAMQGTINDVIDCLLGELEKIGKYDDVEDLVLPDNTDYILDNGEQILVNGKKLIEKDLEV